MLRKRGNFCVVRTEVLPPCRLSYRGFVTTEAISADGEAARCAASQEYRNILLNPNVHSRINNNPQLVPILIQMNPVHTDQHNCLRSILILSMYVRAKLKKIQAMPTIPQKSSGYRA
jgi:hypothetical protein